MDRISLITALFSRALVLKSIGGDSLSYIGVTTTALSDGATTNPITIDGDTVTVTNGNVALYGGDAFVFNGTIWQSSSAISQIFTEIGDLSDLDTEVKTDLVSAINEVNEEKQDDVELSLTPTAVVSDRDIQDGQGNTLSVLAEALTKTASGNPVVISDCAGGKARSLKTVINAIQDLHGYDKPWVGGAGKNKLPLTVATIKSVNGGASSWTGNTKRIQNVDVTIYEDDAGNCTGVLLNGTPQSPLVFALYDRAVYISELKLNGCPSGGATNTYLLQMYNVTDQTYTNMPIDVGAGVDFTPDSSKEYRTVIVIRANQQANNLMFKPMLRLSTESDTSFAPYSNICPISGRTAVAVDDVGINIWDEQWEIGGIDQTTGQNNSATNCIRCVGYIGVTPAQSIYLKFPTGSSKRMVVHWYDKNKAYISPRSIYDNTIAVTVPSNAYYMRFYMTDEYGTIYGNNISVNYPSTFTDYVPYAHSSATISLGQTVYGADINWDTGVMTVLSKYYALTVDGAEDTSAPNGIVRIALPIPSDSMTWTSASAKTDKLLCDMFEESTNNDTYTGAVGIIYRINGSHNVVIGFGNSFPNVSSFNEAKAWITANTPHIVYWLDEPVSIQLTPEQLEILKGYNRVSIDNGTITLDYIAKAISGNDEEIAPLVGDKATKSYAVNDFIERNDGLYRVTAPIASGASFTANNTVKMSIGEALTYLYNK